jgi:hypothetical protein
LRVSGGEIHQAEFLLKMISGEREKAIRRFIEYANEVNADNYKSNLLLAKHGKHTIIRIERK